MSDKPQAGAQAAADRDGFLRGLAISACFLVLSLLVRLPFFFPDVIASDESTFILIGQSMVDGHLPYEQVWDMRPPLAFAPYALAIAAFGKHVAGVRLAGALSVAISAYLVYLIAARLCRRGAGWIAATLCVLAISLCASGQATLTEHLALPPLLASVSLLIRPQRSIFTWAVIGVLMSTATLIRLNLAFVVLAVGAHLLADSSISRADRLRRITAYSVGGALVVAVMSFPYLLKGQLEILWRSAIAAPLNYSQSQNSLASNLLAQSMNAFGVYQRDRVFRIEMPWLTGFVWAAGAMGLVTLLWRWRSQGAARRHQITILTLVTAATGFGIVKSGANYSHYLIQLAPFAAILAAALIRQLPRPVSWVMVAAAGASAFVSMGPVWAEYGVMISRMNADQPLPYGPAYEISAYLRRENPERRPVYLLTDQIVYWFTESNPPTPLTTHPSAIGKQYLLDALLGDGASTEGELKKVFQKTPQFVVKLDGVRFLEGSAKRMLDTTLADQYVLAARIEDRNVYRLKTPR